MPSKTRFVHVLMLKFNLSNNYDGNNFLRTGKK
jgi:hypothetical protein